jgi:hypothetical protein
MDVNGQIHALAAVFPREVTTSTRQIGWAGARTGLNGLEVAWMS